VLTVLRRLLNDGYRGIALFLSGKGKDAYEAALAHFRNAGDEDSKGYLSQLETALRIFSDKN
jgi:hypothetical protein